MDNLKQCYVILWSHELNQPHLNVVHIAQQDLENGFQFGDQFIGDWIIFEDLSECQSMLEAIRKECVH